MLNTLFRKFFYKERDSGEKSFYLGAFAAAIMLMVLPVIAVVMRYGMIPVFWLMMGLILVVAVIYFADQTGRYGICTFLVLMLTNIFILPGYEFRGIDGIITNFHLPKSTLIMMISAFAGRENVLSLYQEAIGLKYRFFSFGDAMLIL